MYHVYIFNFKHNLLYFMKKFNSNYLYIFAKCKKDFLTYVHDKNVHVNIHRIYDIVQNLIFFSKMRKIIIDYVIFSFFIKFSKNLLRNFMTKFN